MSTATHEDPADPSPQEPRVTGAPERIWLVYGELDEDAAHATLSRDGEVSWCEDQQYPSDVAYVRADLVQTADQRAAGPVSTAPANAALPKPHAWVQPNHLQMALLQPFLCRVEPTRRDDFVPLYTADQMRAAVEAERVRLAAEALDAARYRWLAAYARSTSEHWGGRWSLVIEGPAPKRDDCEGALDEAIDAAMRLAADKWRQ